VWHKLRGMVTPPDVAPHGALGDLQPGGQVGAGPAPAALQQRQQLQQPGGVSRLSQSPPELQDRSCPEWSVASGT
jgi:hypothetical protein